MLQFSNEEEAGH